MKSILFTPLALLVFCVRPVSAQPPSSIIAVVADPSGACFAPIPMQYNSANGKYWGCENGTWTQVSGGGGGGTGTVTSVTCGAGLTGGTFTTSGTCAATGVFGVSQSPAPAFSATPTFSLAAVSAQSPVRIEPGVMSANVTAVTFTNVTAGAKFSIAWLQAASGGPYTVTYGGSTTNTCQISPTASVTTTQEFEVGNDGSTVKGTGCTSTETGVQRGPEAAAPGTPAAGTFAWWFDSTNHIFSTKDNNSATVANTVVPNTCTNQVMTALSAAGVLTCATVVAAMTDTSIAHTGVDINTSYQVTATHLASALPIAQGGTAATSAQGNGTKVQLSTGSTTTNDCVKFDANGNTVDAGAGCGGGGGSGTVTSVTLAGTSNQVTVTGTCTGTTTISCTLSIPAGLVLPGTIDGLTITTTTGTLTITGAKVLTVSNSLTLAGTDSTTITFPSTSATMARTDTGQTFTGTQIFSSSPTIPTPSQNDNSTKGASTAYVDLAVANALAGTNPAVAVLAASTASLTGTYANGASGIGATFTVTATGTFTLDGIAINTIGQRVLLKDQSSGFQNGVYTATVVGAVSVSPVFTRALDYDTPSDINSTGAIPVQSGTVNTTTSWLLTSTVTTIGTDALTYVKFSIAPSTIVTASSPGAGIARFAGGTQNATSAELSGDVTTSGSNAATVVKVNGASVPASASALGSNASGQLVAAQIGILASGFIATNQSTSSASFVDLATPDSLTFSCAGTCNFVVQYLATVSLNHNGAVACSSSVFIDGSQADDGAQQVVLLGASFSYAQAAAAGWKAVSAATGSHTVDIKHSASGGFTCSWNDRQLVVYYSP